MLWLKSYQIYKMLIAMYCKQHVSYYNSDAFYTECEILHFTHEGVLVSDTVHVNEGV